MHEIDGHTSTYGLIGHPVGHTMSPKIHNYLAYLTGSNAVYLPFDVERDIVGAVRGAYELNVQGMNVTVPYKNAVIAALTEIDEEALRIGAVNTLVRTENGFKGYNTDVTGLRRELMDAGISLDGKKVVILGAGGAARATAMMCAADKASEIYLMNRNQEKAAELAEAVRQYGYHLYPEQQIRVTALGLTEHEKLPDGLIGFQCTSVGLYPKTEETAISAPEFYRKLISAVDLIYNPEQTMYMRLAAGACVPVYNGSKMLIYQAVAAFELWNDRKLTEEQSANLMNYLRREGMIQ